MSAPEMIYCLKCRKHTASAKAELKKTDFFSRTHKKPMSRSTWEGVCAVCGAKVRKFAKCAKEDAEKVQAESCVPETPAPTPTQ